MLVTKRNGTHQAFSMTKIVNRISKLEYGLNLCSEIVSNLNNKLYSGIQTTEINDLIIDIAIKKSNLNPDYAQLASVFLLSNIYKQVDESFSETMKKLNEMNLLENEIFEIIWCNKEFLDSEINHDNDIIYDFFSLKTFEDHLIKKNDQILERPQHMLMRFSIGLHRDDIKPAMRTYKLMSQRWFIHDTNTLLYAGTPEPMLSHSFQLTIKEDSLSGIYDTLKQTAILFKKTNDIGLNVHCIRSADSYISGSNGYSNGLVTMLKVFNESSNYMCKKDNHGQKQKKICIYLEPWHYDIFEFLDLKKNTGETNLRAKELLYALWIPDLFMERVKEDGNWCLMCPNNSPGLEEVFGHKFVKLYEFYENKGQFKKQLKARILWKAIINAQIETGSPYIVYKDQCNMKSNQMNIGTIKNSNLSTEIVQYSSPSEIATCQLASIALQRFVNRSTKTYDFNNLKEVTKIVTANLNKLIDATYYPLSEAERSGKRHRAISISTQGLADTFFLMNYAFDSDEARKLNIQIFETIYYGALEASCELAERDGAYETYKRSPISKGILQYDMWNIKPTNLWNWKELKFKIEKYGVRNSLLIAQIDSLIASEMLGCNPGCQPINSIYSTKAVNYFDAKYSKSIKIINPHLLNDLIQRKTFEDVIYSKLLNSDGSVQNILGVPEDIKQKYRKAWEIPQKEQINMSVDRAPFIDQSQGLDVHMNNFSFDKITSMHFYVWEKKLKTGLRHLRLSQD